MTGQILEQLNAKVRRSANHNYLVLMDAGEEKASDYQSKMIAENRIPFLLPVETRMCEGRYDLYYEVSSMQSLFQLYEYKEIVWEEVRTIVTAVVSAYVSLQDYLLEECHLILEPEVIYMEPETRTMKFLFLPAYEKSFEDSFRGIAEYLLDRIDHKDAGAVTFGYQFYKCVRRDNFILADIENILQEENDKILSQEDEKCFQEEEPSMMEEDTKKNQQERKKDDVSKISVSQVLQLEPWRIIVFILSCIICLCILFNIIPVLHVNGAGKAVTIGFLAMSIAIFGSWIWKIRMPKEKVDETPNYDTIFADMEDRINQQKETAGKENSQYNEITELNENSIYGKTTILLDTPEIARGVLIEKGKGVEYAIDHYPYLIGKIKESVDLPLKDNSVSRMHARIVKEQEHIFIEDCNSSNGTYLNGILLEPGERALLTVQDEIGIGRIVLLYQ